MGDAEDLGVVRATVVSTKRPEVPTLDLGHLKPLNEELTSHQQCITHMQQSSVHFGGANSTTQASKRSRLLRLARLAHLDNDTKVGICAYISPMTNKNCKGQACSPVSLTSMRVS